MFADFLGKKTTDINIKTLQQQISELNEVSQSLKTYNEILLKSISNINSEEIIKKEDDKLRHRKALRFTRNPMIRYLIRKLNDEILPNEIYEAFIITSNLKAFLKQIKFSAPEVSRFSIMKAAQQDYLKLRNEFLGRGKYS